MIAALPGMIDAVEIIPFQRARLEAKSGWTVRKNSSLCDHSARSGGRDRRQRLVSSGFSDGTGFAVPSDNQNWGAVRKCEERKREANPHRE
jgi:hypothetical protein